MYYLKRLFKLDYKRMFQTIKKISKRSHKSFLWLFIDIFKCSRKFGSGYMDYYCFSFEELNDEQRSTYITRTVSNNYIKTMNNRDFYHIMSDKPTFLNKYKKYIKREFLDLRNSNYDDYLAFVAKHSKFIVKPCDELCGNGVEIIDSTNLDLKELYDRLFTNKQLLLEELIKQSKEMNRLYPYSINTIRMVTCNKNGNVTILFECLRIGNNGSFVDNFNHGGIFSVINEEGYLSRPACDKDLNEYLIHPYTNVDIINFKVPMIDEARNLCIEMAKITPEIGYCGWDIAISENGPCVVECNEMPGYDLYQYRAHLYPSKYGLKKKFDDIIYG